MALATHTDLENRLRLGSPLDTDEAAKADALLETASTLVMQAGKFTDEESAPAIAKVVTLECVVRVWMNPGSVASESMGSISYTYDKNTGLYLTLDEESKLRVAGPRGSRNRTLNLG